MDCTNILKFTDRGIRSLIDASITPAIWGTSRHARCLRQISAYQLTPHEPQICLDHFSQVYSEQLIALLSLADHIRVAPWQSTHDKFLALYPGCVSLHPCGLDTRSSFILLPSSFIVRFSVRCQIEPRSHVFPGSSFWSLEGEGLVNHTTWSAARVTCSECRFPP